MKFLQSLSESRFLTSTSSYRKFSAKQIAELIYLHLCGLRILQCESLTSDFAKNYAYKTNRYTGFAQWYQNATDLHLLIHAIIDEKVELKMPETSDEFRQSLYFDEGEVKSWLRDVSRGIDTAGKARRLFYHLDAMLQVKDGSMKAIRRLVQDWPTNSLRQKQLTMTRLLQMLRVRARQSDILVRLEGLATQLRLELKNVDNPETGDVRKHDGSDPEFIKKDDEARDIKKGTNLLKGLAAFAGGAMLGYHTVKALAEGEEAHEVIREPSLEKLIEMKIAAVHTNGLNAIIDHNGQLHVFDGEVLSHERVRQALGLTEMTAVRLWADYVELVENRDNDLSLLENHPTLKSFYHEGVDVIMEDGSAGATCAGAVAPNVGAMGGVQRRVMPTTASIYPPKKRKKKKKTD